MPHVQDDSSRPLFAMHPLSHGDNRAWIQYNPSLPFGGAPNPMRKLIRFYDWAKVDLLAKLGISSCSSNEIS